MMYVNNRKALAMAFVLVALMSIFVPVASAVSQTWYFCTDLSLDKDAPGAGTYELPSQIATTRWSAEPAECYLTMGAGTWTFDLDYAVTDSGTLSVWVYNGDTYALLAKSSGNLIDKADTHCSVYLIQSEGFDFDTGEPLEVWLRWVAAGGSEALSITCGSEQTTILSPSADPGYPVPELSTWVTFSVGLLVLVGYVAYRRRKMEG